MVDFDLGDSEHTDSDDLTEKFMEHSDGFASLREFIVGQKKALQALGFSEESSDKMAAKLWELYVESMLVNLRNQED